eukprot:7722789-Alexandrium_andersonii.AAC.1
MLKPARENALALLAQPPPQDGTTTSASASPASRTSWSSEWRAAFRRLRLHSAHSPPHARSDSLARAAKSTLASDQGRISRAFCVSVRVCTLPARLIASRPQWTRPLQQWRTGLMLRLCEGLPRLARVARRGGTTSGTGGPDCCTMSLNDLRATSCGA